MAPPTASIRPVVLLRFWRRIAGRHVTGRCLHICGFVQSDRTIWCHQAKPRLNTVPEVGTTTEKHRNNIQMNHWLNYRPSSSISYKFSQVLDAGVTSESNAVLVYSTHALGRWSNYGRRSQSKYCARPNVTANFCLSTSLSANPADYGLAVVASETGFVNDVHSRSKIGSVWM